MLWLLLIHQWVIVSTFFLFQFYKCYIMLTICTLVSAKQVSATTTTFTTNSMIGKELLNTRCCFKVPLSLFLLPSEWLGLLANRSRVRSGRRRTVFVCVSVVHLTVCKCECVCVRACVCLCAYYYHDAFAYFFLFLARTLLNEVVEVVRRCERWLPSQE